MEWVLVVSTLFSPVIAVVVTLWWQRRKERRDAKEKLFLTLMAHRKTFPPSQQWVDGLNVIDVVFAEYSEVVDLWHKFYDALCNPPVNENYQARDHTYLLLLSAMAKRLGYKKLQQTESINSILLKRMERRWN